jgi:hypothetical protein
MSATSRLFDRYARLQRLIKLGIVHLSEFRDSRYNSHNRTFDDVSITDCASIDYGRCEPYLGKLSSTPLRLGAEHTQLVFEVPYCSGSDYSGSMVEKANYKEFGELYPDVPYIHNSFGGHGTFAIFIELCRFLSADLALDNKNPMPENILETIEGLEDYPLIDDEALSQMEMEATEEAWHDWMRDDLRKAIEKAFSVEFDYCDDMSQPNSEQQFRKLFWNWCEKANEYPQDGGGQMYVRIENLIPHIDRDELEPFVTLPYLENME